MSKMAPFSLSSSSGTAMAATSAPVIATAAAGTNGNIHTRRLDVTLKLSQLQNFCKRDPSGYRAEYDAQVRRLESELHVLALQGGKTSGGGGASSLMAAATTGALPPSKLTISAAATPSSLSDGTTLQELMQFVAAVSSSSYKGAESDRIASVFIRLLVGSDPGGDSGSDSNKGDDGGREDHEIDWSGAEAGMASSLSRTQKKKVKEKDKILDVSSVTYLASHNSALQLDRSVRHTAVSCLILMRNKGAIDPLRLLPIFFRLLAVVPDKALRELVYRHMVQDVTNLNKKASADSVNRSLQSFLHRIVETYGQASSGPAVASSATSSSQAAQRGGGDGMIDPQCATSVAARRATDMVADLYRRRVWTGPRAVAILASAAVSGNPGVAARAIRFFLNIEEKMADDQARDRERKAETKMRIDYHAHSKKTAARQRHVERQKKNRAKMLKKKEEEEGGGGDTYLDLAHDKGVAANKKLYPAIELLRDPQGLAEAVLKRLRIPGSYKFEVRLLMMNFCTRLVGNHQLLLLPLYPFLTKYLTSHQRHVTQILCYAVQACHEWVPPDEVHLLLKTIAHNFISQRCSEEQMAVGINAARAICARVPSVLSTEDARDDALGGGDFGGGGSDSGVALDVSAFVKDLAGFANHRDRSVSMAGKSWLNFVRETHPTLLTGKSRGLAGTAGKKMGVRPLRYGEQRVTSGVEGADLLAEYEAKKAARRNRISSNPEDKQDKRSSVDDEPEEDGASHLDDEKEDGWEDVEDEDDDEDGWEEVDADSEHGNDHSEAENIVEERGSVEERDGREEDDDDSKALRLVLLDENSVTRVQDSATIPDLSKMSQQDRERLKQEVSSTRIFSASDFDKMRRLVERERRLRTDPREAARRKRAIARGQDVDALSGDESSDDDGDDDDDSGAAYVRVQGVVDPRELMADAKKKRQTRTEKLERIVAGRTKFAAKVREGGSTNVEKKRTKNFMLSKFSQSARSKSAGKGVLGKRKAPKKQLNHDAKKRRRKV